MYHELEAMSLCEYRVNATAILKEDYKLYIPARVYESALFDIIVASDFETITRALRTCRDAL